MGWFWGFRVRVLLFRDFVGRLLDRGGMVGVEVLVVVYIIKGRYDWGRIFCI